MIWRKAALVMALAGMSHMAKAQIPKGTIMAGGNVGFQFATDHENHVSNAIFTFSPLVGGFVAKNLVMGIDPYFQYISNSGSYTDTNVKPAQNIDITRHQISLGMGPFVRYYFKIGPKAYLYLHGSPSIVAQWNTFNNDPNPVTQKLVSAAWQLGPGFSVMLSKTVALEPSIYYNGTWHRTALIKNGNLLSETKGYVDHGMVFNVGLQVYFERSKKDQDTQK